MGIPLCRTESILTNKMQHYTLKQSFDSLEKLKCQTFQLNLHEKNWVKLESSDVRKKK